MSALVFYVTLLNLVISICLKKKLLLYLDDNFFVQLPPVAQRANSYVTVLSFFEKLLEDMFWTVTRHFKPAIII